MLSKEEVADIITYCSDNNMHLKTRCDELGIPMWKFYDSKRHYAAIQERESGKGEFLQLKSSGLFVQTPQFAGVHSGNRSKPDALQAGSVLNVELQTASGTMMRIQGNMTPQHLMAIIQAGHVQS